MPAPLRRPLRLGLLLSSLLLATGAQAKAWLGITPGASTLSDVVKAFGEPEQRLERDGRTVLTYQGDKAIKGARQANFYVSAAGRVEEIHVFPKATVPVDAIEGTYGKDYVERITEDFRTYYWYGRLGLVVFLAQDAKTLYSLIYTVPEAPKGAQGG